MDKGYHIGQWVVRNSKNLKKTGENDVCGITHNSTPVPKNIYSLQTLM